MLTGSIDDADRTRVRGWARHPSYPDAPISLLITADGRLLERVVANRLRPDLVRANISHGRFGFDVTFNPPLLPTRSWLIHIRSESDGEDVPGSPIRIDPAADFDDTARAAFSAALGAFDTAAELEGRIAFVTQQRDRLLQKRAKLVPAPRRRGARKGHNTTAPAAQALVLDDRVPKPAQDGGGTALLSHMRSLQRLGFRVTFAAQTMAGEDAQALAEAGITCCHSPYFASVEEVLRRSPDSYDLVYLHRVGIAAAYMALVRQYQPRARVVYSVADLHHLRISRQAAFEDQPELLIRAQHIRDQEFLAAFQADAVITHSSAEASLLRQVLPPAKVHVVAWSTPCQPRTVRFADRWGLAFIGNFSHAPNVAAALQLRDEIMPMVNAVNPLLTCRLVGDNLPQTLRAPQPWLDIAGPVADLDELFNTVRFTVAPLPYGAGLKAKVIESFAAGVACICSPIAAEGFDLPCALQSLVVNDSAAAARMILRLHDDQTANLKLAEGLLSFAADRFSESVVDSAMALAVGIRAVESSR